VVSSKSNHNIFLYTRKCRSKTSWAT